ncbi:MAG: hypothetical protein BGO51_25250 [Rhodospirillales bacterium 69-11]|nr:hypothetical protein [Rhodospirillales bacterium]MBN8926546.1 hypothetical protein [Rhodospirillales bacterium]OJW28192.1 MAG: hypothetical protein BGO51_25250 [Rhodospirillales bacterium 69-11]
MRRMLFGLAAAGLTALGAAAIQPALAQQQCTSPADQSTFEIQALRSQLMVLAMGCHADDRYNAVMNRFKPDLQANEKAIDAYFKKKYGRSAQTEHDRFVTELANAISRQGTQLGSDFCPRNSAVFTEVLSLRTSNELAEYAAGKDLVPASLDTCGPATPVHSTTPAKKPALKTAHR